MSKQEVIQFLKIIWGFIVIVLVISGLAFGIFWAVDDLINYSSYNSPDGYYYIRDMGVYNASIWNCDVVRLDNLILKMFVVCTDKQGNTDVGYTQFFKLYKPNGDSK